MCKNSIRRQVWQECLSAMRFPVLLSAFVEILSGTVLVFTANILENFTDAVLEGSRDLGVHNIIVLAACIFFASAVIPAIRLCSDFIMLRQALVHDNIVFGHFLDKDVEEAMRLGLGEIEYELEDAPNDMRIHMVLILGKALSVPVCLGYLLYCAGRVSWLLTALMFMLAAIRLIAPLALKSGLAREEEASKAWLGKQRGLEMDVTSAPYVVRQWGIAPAMRERMDQQFDHYYKESGAKYDSLQVVTGLLPQFAVRFTQVFLFAAGAALVAGGQVDPGAFAAVLVYLGSVQMILANIAECIQRYPLMKNAMHRVETFYTDTEGEGASPEPVFGGLCGRGMGVAFGGRQVFQNLDFVVRPGEKVAVSGENGSGKTTLGRIIAMLFNQYTGTLSVAGRDIRTLDAKAWRQSIAYAPQEPYIFHTTVLGNICMGMENDAPIDSVLSVFGIRGIAGRTVSMDSDLSGGERQKISLLRAILKPAEVLVLDEPTNHLERSCVQWLAGYLRGTSRTVIVITHDEEILQAMNRVIKIH